MERHKCQICYRKFPNGRSLGGHMRSHVMNHPIIPPTQLTESSPESPPSSSSEERESDLEREIGTESDSDSDSFKHNSAMKGTVLKKRRVKKWIETTSSTSPASSTSDVTSEEDVALCLMMLSRDSWVARDKRDGFKCHTCDKVFRSYQALGGHRSSHQKLRPTVGLRSDPGKNTEMIHECRVCFRVFGSAQALGGHKRAHSGNRVKPDSEVDSFDSRGKNVVSKKLSGSRLRRIKEVVKEGGVNYGTSNEVDHQSSKMMIMMMTKENIVIDLNLPPSVDQEDEEEEISQISISAVSDPHFS